MCTLYENIKSLCVEKGITGGKMCVDLKISKSLMTSLKSGRTQSISLDNAHKIADYFGVSVDRVLYGENENKPTTDNDDELTEKQRAAFDLISNMSDEDIDAFIRIASAMVNRS